jgi:DNA-binding transcriptional LysR family regulator
MYLMDTRFLESFVVVAEQGSMTASARRLNLTPAAIAQRIRALEAELGVKLLMRSGRVVRPTEAGFAILERSKDLLLHAHNLKSVASDPLIAGELRIGAINTALTGLLPDILARLKRSHSRLEIFIKPGISMDLYTEVLHGALDAAVIVEPNFKIPKTCFFSTLRDEPLVVIAPATNAGSDAHSVLRREPFIRYDRNNWGGHIADDYLKKADIRPIEHFEMDSLEAIAIMVDRGLGISLVPDWAPPWPEGLNLVKLPLPLPSAKRRIGIVAMRSSSRFNSINMLLKASIGETGPRIRPGFTFGPRLPSRSQPGLR